MLRAATFIAAATTDRPALGGESVDRRALILRRVLFFESRRPPTLTRESP